MPLDLLDLPTGVIEQLAKVRLDAPIAEVSYYEPKMYVFWILREIGHPGLYSAAWDARHSVLKPTLPNVARLGDAEWCRVMLEGGADVEGTDRYGMRAIHWAARFGHKDTVAVLLEHGADVEGKDMDGRRAIHWAAIDGHKDTAAVLLEHGADVNAVFRYGGTALRFATLLGHADTAALLREHGAVE